MNLQDICPLAGPMCDYDHEMLPRATAVVGYLKTQPTWRWWNIFFNRPKPLKYVGEQLLDTSGYSRFLGWDSFTCRNGTHPLSRELYQEFKRVFGRDATLFD
jgi:hypothetical protein